MRHGHVHGSFPKTTAEPFRRDASGRGAGATLGESNAPVRPRAILASEKMLIR